MYLKTVALVVLIVFLPIVFTGCVGSSDPVKDGEINLTRISQEGVLGGVSAGLAYYFGIDVVLVRGGWIALTLLGGAGVLIYIICWAIIPDANFVPQDYQDRIGR